MNFDSTVTLQSSNLDSALDAETRVLCRRLSSYKQFCCSSTRARYAQHKCQRLSPYVFIDCSIRIQVTVTLHGAKTSLVLSKAGTVLIKLKAKTAAAGLSTVCTTCQCGCCCFCCSSSSSSSGRESIAGAEFAAVIAAAGAAGGGVVAALAATGGAAEGVSVGSTIAGLTGTEVGAAGGATGPAVGPALLRLDRKARRLAHMEEGAGFMSLSALSGCTGGAQPEGTSDSKMLRTSYKRFAMWCLLIWHSATCRHTQLFGLKQAALDGIHAEHQNHLALSCKPAAKLSSIAVTHTP